MKKFFIFLLIFFGSALNSIPDSIAGELSGYIEAEGRLYLSDPLYPEQREDSASVAIQPEYYHQWKNGNSFIFTPFARVDSADKERTHFDIRELNFLILNDDWELRLGIGKVFWGVTESQHLVDIINQTDLVENLDGEDKLGQPMAHLSIPGKWGVFDAFALPFFRERTFPGEKGRLRTQLVVDAESALYESDLEDLRPDFALRYSNAIGNVDFGIYHFYGTNREPISVLGVNDERELVWIPYYEIINQTGLDLQLVTGQWLWKVESIYRDGQSPDNFFAFTGGFEYTFVGVTPWKIDIGLLSEWLYDDRGEKAATDYENDIMAGTRLAFNDAASTEVLLGVVADLENDSAILTLESSRRFGNHWKAFLESFFVLDSSSEDTLYQVRKDDYVELRLAYYF